LTVPTPPGSADLFRSRTGHFLLESGHHGTRWLELDSLFVRPDAVEPWLRRLAPLVARHDVEAVCGPLTGGAFVAQWVASELGLLFLYSVPAPAPSVTGTAAAPALYSRAYTLPEPLARLAAARRVAVVDDVINAGSATRASVAALRAAGARVVAAGALLGLGDVGTGLLDGDGVPVDVVESWPNPIWPPAECPLCADGTPLDG
jgi:orotate phosphoribosyltransferase